MDKRKFTEKEKNEYRKFAENHAPKSKLFKDTVFSFIFGGIICVVGEIVKSISLNFGVSEENSKIVVPVVLIFLSCLLTGLGVYDKLAKIAKAGTLVPITGFANAVCSSAVDAKSEGFILGVGAKMFEIAGPVIVYGSITSAVYGVIYYIGKIL